MGGDTQHMETVPFPGARYFSLFLCHISYTEWLIEVDFFTLVCRLHDFKADTSKRVYRYRLD